MVLIDLEIGIALDLTLIQILRYGRSVKERHAHRIHIINYQHY